MPGLTPRSNNSNTVNRSTVRLRLTALLLWGLALLILSLLPGVTSPGRMFDWDKFNHFVAYAVLTALLGRFLAVWQGTKGAPWLLAGLGAFGFGLLLELLQGALQAGRRGEWGDVLANALGVLAACVVFRLMRVRTSVTNDQ